MKENCAHEPIFFLTSETCWFCSGLYLQKFLREKKEDETETEHCEERLKEIETAPPGLPEMEKRFDKNLIIKYFSEVKEPFLNEKEVKELVINIRKNEKRMKRLLRKGQRIEVDELKNLILEMRSKIINSHLRFVIKIVLEYISFSDLSFLDLVQEGNLGLMRAIDKVNFSKGHFLSYARYWIKAYIHKYFENKARLIRIPQFGYEIKRKLERGQNIKEISKEMRVTPKLINTIVEGFSSETEVLSDIPERNLNPFDIFYKKELKTKIGKILGTLNPRESKILCSRFGLKDGKEKTLREVGKEHNLTHERIRQIQKSAFRKLEKNRQFRKLENEINESR